MTPPDVELTTRVQYALFALIAIVLIIALAVVATQYIEHHPGPNFPPTTTTTEK